MFIYLLKTYRQINVFVGLGQHILHPVILDQDLDPFSWMIWRVQERNCPSFYVIETLLVNITVYMMKMSVSSVKWVRLNLC